MSSQSGVTAYGLKSYKYPAEAKTDIEKASNDYHSLQVKFQDFTFESGQTSKLLSLEGTIPVKYMGSVYNIPLAVYFVHQHPYLPPITYVRPTSNMQIKSGPNVDNNGKIFLPYLSEWKFPGSSTLQLLRILQTVFGTRTPVFSRSTATQNPVGHVGFSSSITSPNGSAYGIPGVNWGGMPHLPTSSNSATGGSTSQPQLQTFFGATGSMPPVPAATSQLNYLGTSAGSVAATPSVEEQLLMSLRSAVLEKLNKEQRDMVDNLSCEIQSLESTEKDLLARATNLDTIRAEMISELDQIQSLTRELKSKTKEYKETYQKLKHEADVKVDYDSVVDTTTPVYRQLLETFAEEQAIGDVLYYLSQAMESGAIELDEFLKVVRIQSREQFMKRAKVYQCRAKAGLPPV